MVGGICETGVGNERVRELQITKVVNQRKMM